MWPLDCGAKRNAMHPSTGFEVKHGRGQENGNNLCRFSTNMVEAPLFPRLCAYSGGNLVARCEGLDARCKGTGTISHLHCDQRGSKN